MYLSALVVPEDPAVAVGDPGQLWDHLSEIAKFSIAYVSSYEFVKEEVKGFVRKIVVNEDQ